MKKKISIYTDDANFFKEKTKTKILCLGNEFVKEDSFAKSIGLCLSKEEFEIINIKNSFELLNYVNDKGNTYSSAQNEKVVVLDVVKGLENVRLLSVEDLKDSKIMTAHDFDAGFFLKLINNKKIRIIGIPMIGNLEEVVERVRKLF